MLKLSAQYADLWNTGYMGKPETMVEPVTKIQEACNAIGRDPNTIGITALIGLWFPDLQVNKPSFFEEPLTGTPEEIAAIVHFLSSPDCSFTVQNTPVKTNNATKFEDGPCTRIANGTRVEVEGTRQADGSILATEVEIDD